MNKNDFSEIERLHSEWTMMDKTARLGWLTGERMRLNRLLNQMAQYVYARGGFLNNMEKAYAQKLLDMLQSVETEGAKVSNELKNEALKELADSKGLILMVGHLLLYHPAVNRLKMLIEDGAVLVNGETETRRGKKLRDGDTVSAQGRTFTVRASE